MAIGYSNKRLESIRYRDCLPGHKTAGRLGIATALKNVADTVDQLIANVDHGQANGNTAEAIRDIDHIINRLNAIREALK